MTCVCTTLTKEPLIKLPKLQKPSPPASLVAQGLPTHEQAAPTDAFDLAIDNLIKLVGRMCSAPRVVIILRQDGGALLKASTGIESDAQLDGDALIEHVSAPHSSLLVVPDLAAEPHLAAALGQSGEGVGLYAASSLMDAQGGVLGTLCVIDPQGRDLHPLQREALVGLARQATALLVMDQANRKLRDALAQGGRQQQQQGEYQRLLELHNEQLSTRIRLDMLTGLVNRDTFAGELDEAVELAQARGETLSMAVADIDHFKAINDTHGHPAGDRVLVQVARVLRAAMDDHVLAARQGGEEFVLLMPSHALAAAVRRCDGIQARLRESEPEVPVTMSIGVAQWQAGESAQQLYVRADAALYLAKRSGRDRVVSAFQPVPADDEL